jgi:hypothetical protein
MATALALAMAMAMAKEICPCSWQTRQLSYLTP